MISPAYLVEQKQLHADPRGYGGRGVKWLQLVAQLATIHGPMSCILDYGCGQNSLARALNERGIRTRSYDPAVEEFAAPPKRTDFVVCTDVLEHVEADHMDQVIAHLVEVTGRALFVVVSLVPTAKLLSDGRQAHISLHSRAWWIDRLSRDFEVVDQFDAPEYRPEKQLVAVLKPRTTT